MQPPKHIPLNSVPFGPGSDEWERWQALTPVERFCESEKLLAKYLAEGGTLDPDPDPEGAFYEAEIWRPEDPAGNPDDLRLGTPECGEQK